MKTKISKLIVSMLMFFGLSGGVFAQEYFMPDIKIDDIKMINGHADYAKLFRCGIKEVEAEIVKETATQNEIIINTVKYDCNGIFITYRTDLDKKYPYTSSIQILAPERTVYLKDKVFNVGMPVADLIRLLPEVAGEYVRYLEQEQKFYKTTTLSVEVSIEERTVYGVDYYTGKLAFTVEEGKVTAILVGFGAGPKI